MTVCTAGRYYPFHLILLTIPVLVSSLSLFENNGNGAAIALSSPDFKDAKSAFPQSPLSLFAQDGDGSTNVPIQMCDSSQHHKHAELATVYLNPPCEKAYQAYCGVRRNQNYSLAIHFLTKVPTKSFSVQVTTIDPTFGWETPLWPEFSACSTQFNITCPPTTNDVVQAFVFEPIPKGIPAMRALFRVRLHGIGDNGIKKPYICRQFNLQIY